MRRHGDRAVPVVDRLVREELRTRHHVERIVIEVFTAGLLPFRPPVALLAFERRPDTLVETAALRHHIGRVEGHRIGRPRIVARRRGQHVPPVVPVGTVALENILLILTGNLGQLVVGVESPVVRPFEGGRRVTVMHRIGDPARHVFRTVVADRIVASVPARGVFGRGKRRVIGFVDEIGILPENGLFGPGALVVVNDRRTGRPLGHFEPDGVSVGEGHVDPGRTVLVRPVFLQVDEDGRSRLAARFRQRLGQSERTPGGILLRGNHGTESHPAGAFGRNAVRRSRIVHGLCHEHRTGLPVGPFVLAVASREQDKHTGGKQPHAYHFNIQCHPENFAISAFASKETKLLAGPCPPRVVKKEGTKFY